MRVKDEIQVHDVGYVDQDGVDRAREVTREDVQRLGRVSRKVHAQPTHGITIGLSGATVQFGERA